MAKQKPESENKEAVAPELVETTSNDIPSTETTSTDESKYMLDQSTLDQSKIELNDSEFYQVRVIKAFRKTKEGSLITIKGKVAKVLLQLKVVEL